MPNIAGLSLGGNTFLVLFQIILLTRDISVCYKVTMLKQTKRTQKKPRYDTGPIFGAMGIVDTYEGVAKRAGISEGTLRKILAGGNVTVDSLWKLTGALKIEMTELFERLQSQNGGAK